MEKQLLELYVIARGLLLPEHPRADNELAIPDHPVADQVFEAPQTLNPRLDLNCPLALVVQPVGGRGVATAVPVSGRSVYSRA